MSKQPIKSNWARPETKPAVAEPAKTPALEPEESVDRGAKWCPPAKPPPPPPPAINCCDEILECLELVKSNDADLAQCLADIKTILIGDPLQECGGLRGKICEIQDSTSEALTKICKLLELIDGAEGVKAKICETLECVRTIKDRVGESLLKICDIRELANNIPLIKATVDQIFSKICEIVSHLLMIKQDTTLLPNMNAVLNTVASQTSALPVMATQISSILTEIAKLCQIFDTVVSTHNTINGQGGIRDCVIEIKSLAQQSSTSLNTLLQQGSDQNSCLSNIKTLLEGLCTDSAAAFAKLDTTLLCLTELKSESAQQLTILGHLQQEIDEQGQCLQELKSESDQHIVALALVNTKLDQHGQSLQELKSESDQHSSLLGQTNTKLDSHTSSLGQLSSQLNAVDNAIDNLGTQVNNVKNDTTAIKTCTDVLKTEVNTVQGDISAILQCLSALKEAQFNNRLCLDAVKSQLDGISEVLAEIKCCVCSCPPKPCCPPAPQACVESCAPSNNCGTVCANKGRAPSGITANVQTVSIKCIDDDLVLSFQVTVCNDLPIDSTQVEGGVLTGFQISDALALQGNIDGLDMDDICVENELQASPAIDSLNNGAFATGQSSEFFTGNGIDFKPGDKYTITYSMRVKTNCITCLNHQVLFSATNSNVKCWSLCEPINLCTLKSCKN